MRYAARGVRSLTVLFLCSCGAALQTAVWEEAEPGAWLTGPYLISAGKGSVIVAGRKNVADPPVVEWWLADDVPAGEVPESPRRETMRRRDDLWAVMLTGLPEGPAIAYRVTSGSEPTPIY